MTKSAQQKTYPVCTIRSTPSQPIHCIVWAKSYLLPYAISSTYHSSIPDSSIDSYSVRRRGMKANLTRRRERVKMVQPFETPLSAPRYLPWMIATEIATLRKEAQAFRRVRAALRTHAPDQAAGRIVFEKAGALRQLSVSANLLAHTLMATRSGLQARH